MLLGYRGVAAVRCLRALYNYVIEVELPGIYAVVTLSDKFLALAATAIFMWLKPRAFLYYLPRLKRCGYSKNYKILYRREALRLYKIIVMSLLIYETLLCSTTGAGSRISLESFLEV